MAERHVLFTNRSSSNPLSSQRSRHRSEPKPPIEIPRKYLSERSNLFTFCKENVEARMQSSHIKPRHKLKYSSISIDRAPPAEDPQSTELENEEIEKNHVAAVKPFEHATCLHTMDFDFGRLDDSKLLNRLNTTFHASAVKQSQQQPSTDTKTERSTGHKSNQSTSKAPTVSISLFSASKLTIASKKSRSKDSTNKSTRRGKMHW
jgi:hypothetical protein